MNIPDTLDDYQRTVRGLSDRIVEAQTPVRVLDAVKWDDNVRQAFFASNCRELPQIDRSYYEGRPLAFDSSAKKEEFQNIERDITRQLGQFNPVGQIMRRMCKEYRMVIRMLEARGTADFGLISQELYGAASDAFHAGDPTLSDLGLMLSDYLNNIADRGDLKDEVKTLNAHRRWKCCSGGWTWCSARARGRSASSSPMASLPMQRPAPTTSRSAAMRCSTSATCARWRSTRGWCTSAPR
jgi:hypothetical protein